MTDTPNFRYDQVEVYIRGFRNAGGDQVPYDVNGVIHFMLAALDNLIDQWTEADFEQIGYSATAEQRQMRVNIGHFLSTFTPLPGN
jgi:hypothetical protein